MPNYDYIIIGSGIAGLYTALLAKEHGSVLIVTKGSIEDCNTRYAQGGIAAAIGQRDSPELHYQDTMAAGDGLCNPEAVRILANEAPDRIADLVNLGVPFDTVDGEIALTTEAAHSTARIVHAGGDATGEYVELTLSKRVRQANIKVLEDCLATDVLVENGTIKGVKVFHCRTGLEQEFRCRFLILATGGGGQLFKFNTNSSIATCDGVALAFKAGAEIADMEFFQFHPTALHLPGVEPFLISEAVRGEGGLLRNEDGKRFMPDYTPDAELAPRDVVARSIVREMRKTGAGHVLLDVRHLPHTKITTRFPHIFKFCLDHGLDITKDLVPVAPAAHYMMGGVRTNTWGETNITGLFATGEVDCTGVHGANRLASNSMLEVLIFSKRIVAKTTAEMFSDKAQRPDNDLQKQLPERKSFSLPVPSLSALQNLNWDKVGIMRDREGLSEAAGILAAWQQCIPCPTDRPSAELNNLLLAARLMTEAALLREESRGAHFRSDFPQHSAQWQHHIVFTC